MAAREELYEKAVDMILNSIEEKYQKSTSRTNSSSRMESTITLDQITTIVVREPDIAKGNHGE